MMLYIHLPFCKSKCRYCAFCSGEFPYDIQVRYVDRLISMLEHYARGRTFDTVYIGGGTPSALPRDLWRRMLEALHQHLNVGALREFTVECNPESTDEELLSLLKENGVNRLSFGVQSLCDHELRLIGRLHSADTAIGALRLARAMGFDNVSADLIYGLPDQSKESFERSLDMLLALDISHLSCYNLQLEEGTPLYEAKDRLSFADEDEQMEMYNVLCQKTNRAGMHHYEISNFCKDGCAAIHNSGYWTGKDYIGLGAAAHSKLGNHRYSFADDVLAFVQKSDLEFDDSILLSEEDQREEAIMLGLRTAKGAPLELLDEKRVDRYVAMNLGQKRDGYFVLNDQGFMLSNSIIAELM